MRKFKKCLLLVLCMLLFPILHSKTVVAAETQETGSVDIPAGTAASNSSKFDPNAIVTRYETLKIQVEDPEGKPLSGATVALQTPDNATTTGENGQVELCDLYPGQSYMIYVTMEGYEEWSDTYVCSADPVETTPMTVTLRHIDDDPGDNIPLPPGSGAEAQTDNGSGNAQALRWILLSIGAVIALLLILIGLRKKSEAAPEGTCDTNLEVVDDDGRDEE